MITEEEVAITEPDGADKIRDNWRCARYDMAYPKVLEKQFPNVNKDGFQYLACSGDRSVQIHQQARALSGNLDFVTMTAGGNDLCLVSARLFMPRQRCASSTDGITGQDHQGLHHVSLLGHKRVQHGA